MTDPDNNNPEIIRLAFKRYDTDGNGTIEWDEFCALLDDLGSSLSLQERTESFQQVDTNHTGLISFEEFCDWWTAHK